MKIMQIFSQEAKYQIQKERKQPQSKETGTSALALRKNPGIRKLKCPSKSGFPPFISCYKLVLSTMPLQIAEIKYGSGCWKTREHFQNAKCFFFHLNFLFFLLGGQTEISVWKLLTQKKNWDKSDLELTTVLSCNV